jgi:aspartate beta-hydroxylase
MSDQPARLAAAAAAAVASGNFRGAEPLLAESLRLAPRDLRGWLNLAAVRRQLGAFEGAMGAVREALALDPRHFAALLMQASLLERAGQTLAAAQSYGIALVQAPPDEMLDPATRQAVAHGRALHERYLADILSFVQDRVADSTAQCSAAERRRVEAFVGIALRTRPRYQQDPSEYYYPGLPPIEFFDRSLFPWLEAFEAETPAIRAELDQVLATDSGAFAPYIQYDKHLPLDQWAELNHSPRWKSFHFYDRGTPIAEHHARAPRTAAAAQALPQAVVQRRSPTAMYSVLQPRTRIPPHTGIANFRLVVHLPLVLPGQCGFRVGGETREWRLGEAWVFDDTIEHEAWNHSDAQRVILICDIWHPFLSPQEQAAIAAAIAATDTFHGITPGPQL